MYILPNHFLCILLTNSSCLVDFFPRKQTACKYHHSLQMYYETDTQIAKSLGSYGPTLPADLTSGSVERNEPRYVAE